MGTLRELTLVGYYPTLVDSAIHPDNGSRCVCNAPFPGKHTWDDDVLEVLFSEERRKKGAKMISLAHVTAHPLPGS